MKRFTTASCLLLLLLATRVDAQRADTPGAAEVERASGAFRNLFGSIGTPSSLFTDSADVRKAFREVVADARRATVRVRVGGKNRSLGGIVGPDGWVLTKASRLNGPDGDGPVTVELSDNREFDARVVGVDRDYDLAMLKVDAKGLPTLDLSHTETPEAGDWVAAVSTSHRPVAVGVLSVGPRKIAHRPGILGIQLSLQPTETEGALVVRVYPNTGAEAAGVLANDVVTSINDQPVCGRVELIDEVRKYSPGDTIEVRLLREGAPLTLYVTLTGRNRVMRMNRSEYQNSLGGSLSQRRFGFPSALQHDAKLEASECGGPLVDLDGHVIGFNLARSGRTESYAAPTAELPERLFSLMSGSLPPE